MSLLVLSREVNILFISLLIAWSLFHRRWKDIAMLMIPLAVFVLWHGLIYRIFGIVPFLLSADKRALPFSAIIDVLRGVQGFNRLTASSMAYFLLFFLPALVWIAVRIIKRAKISFLEFGSLAFLLLMSTMAWDIWGSITSIGRVITPVYPLTMLYAAEVRTIPARFLALSVLALGLAIGLALALTVHPYHLA